jgi:hypothetical protein
MDSVARHPWEYVRVAIPPPIRLSGTLTRCLSRGQLVELPLRLGLDVVQTSIKNLAVVYQKCVLVGDLPDGCRSLQLERGRVEKIEVVGIGRRRFPALWMFFSACGHEQLYPSPQHREVRLSLEDLTGDKTV